MIKLDGAALAKTKLIQLQHISQTLRSRPMLAIISVGNDPASAIYVKMKMKIAKDAGFQAHHHALEQQCSQENLHKTLQEYSQDNHVHGILLQLPLPSSLSAPEAMVHIAYHKDVDGLHPMNMGWLQMNRPLILPCTPKGILSLLVHYDIPVAKQRVVILGRSLIVGLPLSLAMMHQGATVTLCHRDTQNPETLISQADIVVSATGTLDVFDASLLKKGSVFVDVGIHRSPEGLRGDIAFQALPSHLKAYTPVPYGIGPMTVISLMENLLILYQHTQNAS